MFKDKTEAKKLHVVWCCPQHAVCLVLSPRNCSRVQITTLTHGRGQSRTHAILVASTALFVPFAPCGLIGITPALGVIGEKHDFAQVEKIHRKFLGLDGFSSVSFFFKIMYTSLKC